MGKSTSYGSNWSKFTQIRLRCNKQEIFFIDTNEFTNFQLHSLAKKFSVLRTEKPFYFSPAKAPGERGGYPRPPQRFGGGGGTCVPVKPRSPDFYIASETQPYILSLPSHAVPVLRWRPPPSTGIAHRPPPPSPVGPIGPMAMDPLHVCAPLPPVSGQMPPLGGHPTFGRPLSPAHSCASHAFKGPFSWKVFFFQSWTVPLI